MFSKRFKNVGYMFNYVLMCLLTIVKELFARVDFRPSPCTYYLLPFTFLFLLNFAQAQIESLPQGVRSLPTTPQDSLSGGKKNIKEDISSISPEAIFNYQDELTDSLSADQRRRPFMFPTDTLSGFSQTLGFTGKPILRWVDGREGREIRRSIESKTMAAGNVIVRLRFSWRKIV